MAEEITGRIGLIGDPVAHSLSPAFQQPAFDHWDIPVTYELWHTSVAEIPSRLNELRTGEIFGANVTVPHKEAFFRSVDLRSAVAERARAVNTVLRRDGLLYGDNTDVYGFITSLQEAKFTFASSNIVVIGAGGAARGVVAGLLEEPIESLTVANRTLGRADALVRHFDDPRLLSCGLEEIASRAENCDLMVNAAAIGWDEDRLPVGREVFEGLAADALAFDLTYRDTPFLKAAAAAGVRPMDGLAMLVHQGARSFELWTGLEPPLELMMQIAVSARQSSE